MSRRHVAWSLLTSQICHLLALSVTKLNTYSESACAADRAVLKVRAPSSTNHTPCFENATSQSTEYVLSLTFNPRMLWGHCCSCTLRGSSTIMLKHASPGMKACSKLSQRRIPSPNTPYSRCLLPLPKVKPMSFNFLNTDRENFGTSLWLMSRQRGLTCSPRSLAPRKAHLEHLYDLGFVLLGVGLVNGSLHQSP
jgi:hypothetical protein